MWEKRSKVSVPRWSLFGQYGPDAQKFYYLVIPREVEIELEDETDERDPLFHWFPLPEWVIDKILATELGTE